MRLISIALALLIAVGCVGPSVALPTFNLPSFNTAELERLVDDALAQVDRAAAAASIELPSDLAQVLADNNITLPAPPTNATEICATLGIPGASAVAGAGLTSLIEALATGTEVGLVVGLLVAVVFRTCPIWMPHLETAIDQVL